MLTRFALFLTLLLISLSSAALASPKVYLQDQLQFTVSNTVGKADELAELISIKSAEEIESTEFLLSNPPRLVVDFKKLVGKYNRSEKIAGLFVSAYRFGSHPDKIRLVFDLQVENLKFEITRSNNAIQIYLSQAVMVTPNAPANSTASPTATSTPSLPKALDTTQITRTPNVQATAISTNTPEAIATAIPSPTTTSLELPTTPSFTSTPLPQITKSNDKKVNLGSGNTLVNAVIFERQLTDKLPIFKITLASKSEFKFSKRDERSFSLVIPNARLSAAALTLPNFPPHDFNGFTFTIAKAVAENVEITIGVERGIKIIAVAKDNEIIIKKS